MTRDNLHFMEKKGLAYKETITAPIAPPTNPGAYNETTHLKLEVHRAVQQIWNRYANWHKQQQRK